MFLKSICYNLDWIVVRFVDYNIIQLCAEKSFQKKLLLDQSITSNGKTVINIWQKF